VFWGGGVDPSGHGVLVRGKKMEVIPKADGMA